MKKRKQINYEATIILEAEKVREEMRRCTLSEE